MIRVDWVSQMARDAIVYAGGRVYRDDKMQAHYQIPGKVGSFTIFDGSPSYWELPGGQQLILIEMAARRVGLVTRNGEDDLAVQQTRMKWLVKTGHEQQAA